MEQKHFDLIDAPPTQDLLYLLDLTEENYEKKTTSNNISFYRIKLEDPLAKMAYDLIKDIDIFIPRINRYLSDFIFMRTTPTKAVLAFLNKLTVDQLFAPFITSEKAMAVKKKYDIK